MVLIFFLLYAASTVAVWPLVEVWWIRLLEISTNGIQCKQHPTKATDGRNPDVAGGSFGETSQVISVDMIRPY